MVRASVLQKMKLEQTIELLRQDMVDKLLMSGSYQSDEVLGASQALDRILNCYDCVRYGRKCGKEANCTAFSFSFIGN